MAIYFLITSTRDVLRVIAKAYCSAEVQLLLSKGKFFTVHYLEPVVHYTISLKGHRISLPIV